MKKIFTGIVLLVFALSARSQSIVISQVYGGGGNAGATYTNDFIELFNRGASPVSINGWSVQYASATGTTWQVTNLTNVTLQPGQYYLVQEAQGAGGSTPLPTPDATGTIAMSATAGKVALVTSTTALTGACPAGLMDFVGYGTTANCFEGSGPTPAPSNTNAVLRGSNGCTDNNDNATDFTAGLPTPRNTLSSFNVCGGGSPTLSISSPLAAFGNVCINTTAGPNSFTITGTNLTSANVTVAALSGYTYATTAGGTYTSSLSLTQPGGSYSQQIFVKFTPAAVQSYNGNIVVGGGGASSVNAAASGAGINTMPSVTTGSASSITTNSATAAGTITSTGCSAIIAYGIEYSTLNGFANGAGTAIASSNLSGGNFSSNLTGLASGTTYYYHAYATNAGGTAYGSQQSFTTLVPAPSLAATALAGFGNVCINTTAGPNSFTITGVNLTNADVIVGALAGFTYSTTSGGVYTSTLTLSQPGGSFSQQVFVNFTPTAVQSYNGNIGVSGGGAASPVNVAATGSGVNNVPSLSTGGASLITQTSARLAGTITDIGCSPVSAYGVEYSITAGFPNGSGTAVPSTNLSGGNFSSDLAGLNPATTYYYHAYATNAAGTGYGAEQSFTTLSPNPAITTSSLPGFGSVCINTTAGPNSFTISGTNLTNADVTVSALAGFTYSTTSGGTYTTTLSLPQPGGTYAQQVFVKFSPTAVQSYNGNIVVGGGGAPTVNVAASGSGVNTAPSVSSGAASAITSTSATVAGTISSIGCSAISVYGIEYSTTNGFANGTGTAVTSSNLSGGNFSSALSGLSPSTVYYYHAYSTNAGGTGYGAQQSFTTLTPTITSSALTAFGGVCINTTAGPNSFTITGNNLTNANVTVGALAGFTYSTTSGGTYATTLSLPQPGGTYAQQIFVKFSPTAVQSYNGNIPVGGGGAATVNAAAAGSGVNTAPSVTSGAASAITSTSATVAGTIGSTGCSAIAAYGIEYSTTNGFANGTGIAVTSSNLSGGNFSSALSGLNPNTVYYYHAYATNAGGTGYGAQQSFTTLTPAFTNSALTPFGSVCINSTAGPNSFTITGNNLTSANVTVGALSGFTYSTTAGGTYTSSLSIAQPGGSFSQQVFVKFSPVAVQSYNGNISVGGGGASNSNVAASGDGVNTLATVITGASSNLTNHSVTLSGSIAANGCSNVTVYGIELSGINGFIGGTGTPVASTNLAGVNFSASFAGLVQGATYYYKAYAVNNGGTSYGLQQSFTVAKIADGFTFYPVPALKGKEVRISMNKLAPGYYGLLFFDSGGKLVYQRDMNIQADFINQSFTLPYRLPPGTYRVQLVNHLKILAAKSITIF